MKKTDKELEDDLNQIVVDLLKEVKEAAGDDNAYLNSLNGVD